MTATRALPPFYSEARQCWIVGIVPAKDAPRDASLKHVHCTFDTEVEALAFVAKNNGVLQ